MPMSCPEEFGVCCYGGVGIDVHIGRLLERPASPDSEPRSTIRRFSAGAADNVSSSRQQAQTDCLSSCPRVSHLIVCALCYSRSERLNAYLLSAGLAADWARSATHRCRSLKLLCICSSAKLSAKKRSAASAGRWRVSPWLRTAAISAAKASTAASTGCSDD